MEFPWRLVMSLAWDACQAVSPAVECESSIDALIDELCPLLGIDGTAASSHSTTQVRADNQQSTAVDRRFPRES